MPHEFQERLHRHRNLKSIVGRIVLIFERIVGPGGVWRIRWRQDIVVGTLGLDVVGPYENLDGC